MMSCGRYDVVMNVLQLTLETFPTSAETFDQTDGIKYCYKCEDRQQKIY